MKSIALVTLCTILSFFSVAQKHDNPSIKALVEQFKQDPKGPYKDIRWFCKDGSTRPPTERCPEPGLQRARYKDEVLALAKNHHIYLGQILATTEYIDFWDETNNHKRLKQYQLEKYLFRTDNGWILRKAQFYRGAFQAEDEENWGVGFFHWLLDDNNRVKRNFFLIREAAKDIPHQGDDSKTQLVRSLSKEISDSVPSFLNIRIKIHGQPDATDIQTVKQFRESNLKKLTANQLKQMDALISNMEMLYQPANLNTLIKYLKNLPKESKVTVSLKNLIEQYNTQSPEKKVMELAQYLLLIREQITSLPKSTQRLALIDISLRLEDILFRDINVWKSKTLQDVLSKTHYLGMAAAGSGYLEMWEWEKIKSALEIPASSFVTLEELNNTLDASRRMVEWSAGMYRAVYKNVIELFSGFEPLVYGFSDDRIRSTILLYLGYSVSELGDFIALEANLSNKVLDLPGQSHIRGINPGYALGELVVIKEVSELTDVSADKIYVFDYPPADLKPVAGIATVTEGNMVSHVQLLARNLGIPNAVISTDNLEHLKKYSGKTVFYAVSNKGTVLMKTADKMTPDEKQLFATKKRNEEKVVVPVDRMNLSQTKILNLREVNANQSGILCGPKAANLGQLKQMFPDHVVEGFVIPFGIFRQHMEQLMPGKNMSYWEFLNHTFSRAEEMQTEGKSESEIETYVLGELEKLRNEIKAMPLKPEFIVDLEKSFTSVLGIEIGEIPVFLRSDTNMEDLKDFTGAGLNLTIFNVADREKILQGIRDVWASPYSERSYKWRQRFLLNPENVYPSILVIPSVDVDYSGVLITKGISSGNDDDLTIAFSRGAGGAVEGQAAESYLLRADGENVLLSPARESSYNKLPAKGGTEKRYATYEKPILSESNLAQLRDFSHRIMKKMEGDADYNAQGPFDIELGFKDNKVWLFQIRPFVENKNALKTEYLNSISPDLPTIKSIPLNTLL